MSSPSELIPQGGPVNPVKKSSGCLPFFMGCLTAIVFMLVLLGGLSFGAVYMAKEFIDRNLPKIYATAARPFILKNLPVPEDQKQEVLSDLDELMRQYPTMSLAQKKEAIEQFAKKWQHLAPDAEMLTHPKLPTPKLDP